MASFFTSASSHEFGLIKANGTFEVMDQSSRWQNDHGDVVFRVTLVASGTSGYTSFFTGGLHNDKAPAYVRIHLDYNSSGSTWTLRPISSGVYT